MRLLIITQKVDKNDPILGFFHRWLSGFASRCDRLIVIGQSIGEFDLPPHVEVLSLGKENGKTKWQQIRRFWRIICGRRRDYDVVFVHMTPVWVVLGGALWKAMGKSIFLWYEVKRGGGMLAVALKFVEKVFCATRDGLPFPSRKQLVIGHGIDTDVFSSGTGLRDERLLLTVGRMTPIKRYEVILAAVAAQNERYQLVIAGGPILPSDHAYQERVRALAAHLTMADRLEIRFLAERDLITAYRSARVLLHACGGGLDKVVLEAMACGCPVLSSSEAARHVLPPDCQCTADSMGEKLETLLLMPVPTLQSLCEGLRQTVVRHHSLARLLDRLVAEMSVA